MTLAAILVFLLLISAPPGGLNQDQAAPASPAQAKPAQNSQPSTGSSPTKMQPRHPAHPKKKKNTDCTSTSGATAGAKSRTGNSADSNHPCAPKKVIVKNGGSDDSSVQLKGDTPPAKASNDLLNTEQLRLVTEDNLKKIASRQLTESQQEMLNQIRQFMDQSKAAVADGDLERGHNLAVKARLLSDELAGP